MRCGRYLTKEEIKKIGKHNEVDTGKFKVSDLPLVSFGYWSCRAVSLKNERRVGLSHMSYRKNPWNYIEGMIHELGDPPTGLKAIVVETDRKYPFKLDEEYFNLRGIELVGKYVAKTRSRDILASLNQVIVYSREGKEPIPF